MSTAQDARAALAARINARLTDETRTWLVETLQKDLNGVRQSMAQVGRMIPHKHLIGSFSERDAAEIPGPFGAIPVGHWHLDAAVRVLLIATAAQAMKTPHQALFDTYDQGETETREACLRATNLVLGESTERAMEMIHDAGRTYQQTLMAAGWTRNPFTSTHIDDEAYRKAVLKALFCDVPIDGFIDLDTRANAALADSLCQYADERLAAGRPVPPPVWVISALHPQPGLIARLIGMLEHPLPDDRLVAARALVNAKDQRTASFIDERLAREDDERVVAVLKQARAHLALDE